MQTTPGKLGQQIPTLAAAIPEQIQLQIVNNMIERTQSWGITWKSAIVNFAELMITIAPNFDQQADIKTVLASDRELVNQRMKILNQYVPEQAWKQAEAAYESLPLYHAKPYLQSTLTEQTRSAIPLVLWDKEDTMDKLYYLNSASDYAEKLGLHTLTDATLTIVVWRSLYGITFNNPEINAWVVDITNSQHHPWQRLAMLKYRIALDYGRRI
ncbi:MAG: hypothetical protein L3J75_16145 [Methylococcaceae bacterium]|nr:hypothetical protein [Methylococcaceae bacterium]